MSVRRQPLTIWQQWIAVALALGIGFTLGSTYADWRRIEPIAIPDEWATNYVPPPPRPLVKRVMPPLDATATPRIDVSGA